jgi:putative oxidoreductase
MSILHYRHGIAMFILRIIIGTAFIMHGGQKLISFFTLEGFTPFVTFISALGLPPFLAYLVPFAEFFGGVMVLLGFATELGALMIIPVMVGAVFLVHWKNGYFLPNGFEYALNLLLGSIALIIGGPGILALWNPFSRPKKTVIQ